MFVTTTNTETGSKLCGLELVGLQMFSALAVHSGDVIWKVVCIRVYYD